MGERACMDGPYDAAWLLALAEEAGLNAQISYGYSNQMGC